MFKKNSGMKERASTALANLQRNSYSLSILRTRLESKIGFMLNGSDGKAGDGCQELTKVLELVKHGELVLNELSEKIEAAKFLEEFVSVIENATTSVKEIKDDVEMLVPEAEEAIREMNDAMAKIRIKMNLSGSETDDDLLKEEIQNDILCDVAVEISRKAEESEKLSKLMDHHIIRDKAKVEYAVELKEQEKAAA